MEEHGVAVAVVRDIDRQPFSPFTRKKRNLTL